MARTSPRAKSRPKARLIARGRAAGHAKRVRSLEAVVGPTTYRVWCAMLASLVPGGRTHRLAPLVGGMLQYAAVVAVGLRPRPPEGSAAASLLDALGTPDPEPAITELEDVVGQIFRDARVPSGRVSARGDGYSIADAAIAEFVQWESMPWE